MREVLIATLATCHNRRSFTIRAFESLHAQILPSNVRLLHYLVDDGSNDGTTEAVKETFPGVKIFSGSGNLYWAGGMRHGWNQIKNQSFDFLFVYNDDVEFIENAIEHLLECFSYRINGVFPDCVSGAVIDSGTNIVSYGGLLTDATNNPLSFKQIMPNGRKMLRADTVNMNACLISREILSDIGFLSDYFVHNGADYEFGLRVNANGGYCGLAPNEVGFCALNAVQKKVHSFKQLLSPHFQPPRQRFYYYRAHGGKLWFLALLDVLYQALIA